MQCCKGFSNVLDDEVTSQHGIPADSRPQLNQCSSVVSDETYLMDANHEDDCLQVTSANKSTSNQHSTSIVDSSQSSSISSQLQLIQRSAGNHANVPQSSNGIENEGVDSQSTGCEGTLDIANIKSMLQIREFREFQLNCIRAVSVGSDMIVV